MLMAQQAAQAAAAAPVNLSEVVMASSPFTFVMARPYSFK
jgi:hypothetical protein